MLFITKKYFPHPKLLFNDIEEKISSIFIDIGKKMAVFLM
jgi:hypothetical protein